MRWWSDNFILITNGLSLGRKRDWARKPSPRGSEAETLFALPTTWAWVRSKIELASHLPDVVKWQLYSYYPWLEPRYEARLSLQAISPRWWSDNFICVTPWLELGYKARLSSKAISPRWWQFISNALIQAVKSFDKSTLHRWYDVLTWQDHLSGKTFDSFVKATYDHISTRGMSSSTPIKAGWATKMTKCSKRQWGFEGKKKHRW